MANPEHLEILKQGVEVWNEWRKENPNIQPDLCIASLRRANLTNINFNRAKLTAADLTGANLRWTSAFRANFNGANLARAILHDAFLTEASLINADLSGAGLICSHVGSANLNGANLSNANLRSADLTTVNLSGANLSKTYLEAANLSGANLTMADLSQADLRLAHLAYAILRHANLSEARIGGSHLGNNDLSEVVGLESIYHYGPSIIDVGTLYKFGESVPENFLRGCGIPDSFITFLPSIVGAEKSLQFYSCFISYNHKDGEFARRLYSHLREAGLRVWFAPEEIQGGRKIHDQIFNAIQVHDKLLLVLSKHSMQSEWVKSEIRRARRTERNENRRKLFPIRLVDFETIQNWECFDMDIGKDLAIDVREYFIPDFSNWQDKDAFKIALHRLLHDLKTGVEEKWVE